MDLLINPIVISQCGSTKLLFIGFQYNNYNTSVTVTNILGRIIMQVLSSYQILNLKSCIENPPAMENQT
jgi:hypothetical protein